MPGAPGTAPTIASAGRFCLPGGASATNRARWQRWADANLQDGDVLFLRADCYLLFGTYDFTWLSTTASDSPFSHVAVVAREADGVVAYDTSMAGAKRWEFGELVTHPAVEWIAVRRPHGAAAAITSVAVDYCRQVIAADVPYDTFLETDDEKIYCSELVAKAYLTGGVKLTEPTAIAELPGIDRINPAFLNFAERVMPIDRRRPVWSLGNDRYGLWSSKHLVPLVAPIRSEEGPPDVITLSSAGAPNEQVPVGYKIGR